MKVSLDEKLLKMSPDARVYLLVAKDVNVMTSESREIVNLLRSSEADLREDFTTESLFEDSRVKSMVDLYDEILDESEMPRKTAKKILPSHVAMAKRVLKGDKIPNINPLVNYYNAVSLRYLVSIGAENLDQYYGDLKLQFAKGDEHFLPIGGEKMEKINKGEINWIDDLSVTCRMWGWRQCARTQVDKDTKNILFFIDGDTSYSDKADDEAWQAAHELANGLKQFFNVESDIFLLKSGKPVVDIGYSSRVYDPTKVNEEEMYALTHQKKKGTKGIRKRKPVPLGIDSDEQLLKIVERELLSGMSAEIEDIDLGLDYSPESQFGDFSSNAPFKLAPIRKESSYDSGKWLAEQISTGSAGMVEIDVADNGFVNFKLSDELMLKLLMRAIEQGDAFGSLEQEEEKVILVESPSWNPNKSPHVGHMLNLFLGKSLIRLFENVGLKPENDNIANDKGLPVMQTIWAYEKYGDGATPESTGDKADHFVQRYYVLGKKKYDESNEVKGEVKELLKKWEEGDKEVKGEWEKIISWAYKGQYETVERVWEEMGYIWNESDVYEGGKEIVNSRIDGELIEKLDDGAVVARVEQEYGVPDTVLIKSNGTGLYHTQDIFLTLKKKEKYNDPWRMTWVVADEQIVHFQRLFAILDALEIMPIDNLYHYAYSLVVGKDGKKLSSRDGDDLYADDLLDQMKEAAKVVLLERGVDEEKINVDEVSEVVAIGALKYALLSRDPFKQIKFDVDEAIAFQGKSGPYVMYTYTRAQSVLRKLGVIDEDGLEEGGEVVENDVAEENAYDVEISDAMRRLTLQLLRYPEVVLSAANNYSPGILAEYLFELAKSFNNFYENDPVIGSEDDELKLKVDLLNLYSQVVKDGLGILGIKVLDRM